MTVFKTFWKVLNKNKLTVIIYTAILLVFGISNMKTSEQTMSFQAEKPNIVIINLDEDTELIDGFVNYLNKNCNVKKLNDDEKLNDALFYREVSYIVYIPKNFTDDFMAGKDPELEIKSTEDYAAAYAEMIVTRFVQMAKVCQKKADNQSQLITEVNDILKNEAQIKMTTKLDTKAMQKATVYYNFASYSLIACLIFMIGLILNSFNEEKIKKRIIISSENYKMHNRVLLLSNCCYSLIMWVIYVSVSFVILKNTMFSIRGLLYVINSFVFTISITALSFLIANLVTNKEALSGISNVVSLGSSFLCGAFVPVMWLPDLVLKIAHIFPTYYYIHTNEAIGVMEKITSATLKPIIIDLVVMIGFAIVFIILANVVVKRKRRIG